MDCGPLMLVLMHGVRWPTRDSLAPTFERHAREVIAGVPPKQLLVLDVQSVDAYERLAGFLGKQVPRDRRGAPRPLGLITPGRRARGALHPGHHSEPVVPQVLPSQ